jgi:fumarate hydratase subunit beta
MAEDSLHIKSPIERDIIDKMTAGTRVLISGVIYTARDAAHRRIVESLDKGEELPFDLAGQTIYYAGPSPARPGEVTGSVGPTTSSRMDVFTPRLLAAGLRAMIGKGNRSAAVREAIIQYRGVYFVAVGGAAALIARSVRQVEVVAYDDLGPEAIRRLTVKDFPAIVANDAHGRDLFEQGKAQYRRGR